MQSGCLIAGMCALVQPPPQVRVDDVARLDGAVAASGTLGSVVDLHMAHKDVLEGESGDVDFGVYMGDSSVAPSPTGETCPADYLGKAA